jgi:hypothetical protein
MAAALRVLVDVGQVPIRRSLAVAATESAGTTVIVISLETVQPFMSVTVRE